MKIYPVILSGGSGSRLWPLSRAALPKQLLPLVTERTMLQDTVLRVASWKGIEPPLVVCKDYCVSRVGQMQHVSECVEDYWRDARDRRGKTRTPEAESKSEPAALSPQEVKPRKLANVA